MKRTDNGEKNEFGLPGIGIPAEVLIHPNLTSTEKLLFGLIKNLSYTDKGCWATNKWLAGMLGVRPQTISNAVKSLKEANFITTEYIQQANDKKVRRIYLNKEYPILYTEMVREAHQLISKGLLKFLYRGIKNFIPPYKKTINNQDSYKDIDRVSKETYDFSNHENINSIISHWNSLPNTVSHSIDMVQPSKVYESLCTILNNMLIGLPIDCKKNQEPTKPFEEFCHSNQIPDTLTNKEWGLDEIKQVLTQIANQYKGEKSLSLDSVLWSRFGRRGKGASPFLIYASESFVDQKYKNLVSILIKAHSTKNIGKQIQWARQFELELYSENLNYNEVKTLLEWYVQHYKNKYVPLCDDPFSFIDNFESLKNMKRNMGQNDQAKKSNLSINHKEDYFNKHPLNIEID